MGVSTNVEVGVVCAEVKAQFYGCKILRKLVFKVKDTRVVKLVFEVGYHYFITGVFLNHAANSQAMMKYR